MKLGFDPIDQEHDILLDLIAGVERSIASGAPVDVHGEAFDKMVEWTDHHFRSEEHWMEISQYPGLTEHRREHKEVMMWLVHLQKDLRESTAESISSETGTATIEFFRSWVDQHLKQLDAPAVRHISEAQGQGKLTGAVVSG